MNARKARNDPRSQHSVMYFGVGEIDVGQGALRTALRAALRLCIHVVNH